MTAFAALFHRDGRPVDRWPNGGLAALRQRGVSHIARNGPVMLAGTAMEAPFPGTARPVLIVAADVRLDNRAEIEAGLGLPPCPHLPDASLIAALYDRYGPDCTAYLLGDFAFLLWDEKERMLFGARDHFGVRPFYYHSTPGLFMAATTIGTLLQSGISTAIDDVGMADFVAGAVADTSGTLYRHIRRLPPGHSVLVTEGDVRIQRYWELTPQEPPPEKNWTDHFRHLFEQAVACRMANASTGVLLSGGLDSSSIAMTASRIGEAQGRPPLSSLSMTFDATSGWSDGAFIQSVVQTGRFSAQYLPSDDHDPLRDMDAMLDEQDGLYLAYNHGVSRRLYHHAGRAGITSLLDGHGGDEVVSHGFGRLNELAMAHRWASLWRESRGVAQLFGGSTWEVAAPHLDHVLAIRKIRQRWRRMSSPRLASPSGPNFTTALVAPDLARRTATQARQDAIAPSRSAYQTEQQRHLAILTGPHQPYAFEILDRAAAAAGIELLFPFYDRRLVDFCLSLPASAKLAKGYPRAILRDAMVGTLPEPVRLRRDKFDFSGQLRAGMARHRAHLKSVLDGQADMLAPYVDLGVARTTIAQLDQDDAQGTAPLFAAWRIAVLGRWLARSADGIPETVSACGRTR